MSNYQPMPPLIVTLTLDDAAQAHFDRLRSMYFPPDRLVVGAHVTMFHAIPAEREHDLLRVVAALCAESQAFAVSASALRFLGRGVAYDIAAPPAHGLRDRIAQEMSDSLSPQDKARWLPHITIQNKVAPLVARQTQAVLGGQINPSCMTATGIGVWRYLGGPWEAVRVFSFGDVRKLGGEAAPQTPP